jgi:6-phosphofructokinase 1
MGKDAYFAKGEQRSSSVAMKRIAVLTSGGDAPGMNAALRAVVRTGVAAGFEVLGVRHGYTGLIAGEFARMEPRDVGGIIGRGGTVLGTTRCEELRTETGQVAAARQVRTQDISGLIVIGGNGSQSGTLALAERGVPVIGIASTIDNDLAAIDVTIGATTALDTALEAIDRLRVTASSHQRAFLVEVMGRHCGYLALMAGITGGAESIVVPEAESHPEAVAEAIRSTYLRGKSHAIVVVAEGAKYDAEALGAYFREHKERLGFDLRVTRLGHIQRGGVPCAFDRLIATELGAAATAHLKEGRLGVLLGIVRGEITPIPLTAAALAPKSLDARLFELAGVLAR